MTRRMVRDGYEIEDHDDRGVYASCLHCWRAGASLEAAQYARTIAEVAELILRKELDVVHEVGVRKGPYALFVVVLSWARASFIEVVLAHLALKSPQNASSRDSKENMHDCWL